jgi:hypothetical protein
MAATGPKKISWWHEMLVDMMLARPEWSGGDLAEYFEVTESWLSQIINSDIFRAYRAQRFHTHQEKVSVDIIDKVEKLAVKSLDVLDKKMDVALENIADVPIGPVRETSAMALKALGYGVNNGSAVQVNIGIADPKLLIEARQTIRKQQELPVVGESSTVQGESHG